MIKEAAVPQLRNCTDMYLEGLRKTTNMASQYTTVSVFTVPHLPNASEKHYCFS
jgi:hypothetical protein